MRADVFLTEHGLAKSRTKAADLISAGKVICGDRVILKASEDLTGVDPASITVLSKERFVSRGGEKLDAALDAFAVDPTGLVAVDIGASTGGFTDCLLQRGTASVYAIDAGSGQLDPALCGDKRVVNIEKCNARFSMKAVIPQEVDLAVSDVSFISQTLILPNVPEILKPGGKYIALIKPQFECGPSALNKKGIVKDPKMHRYAIRRVAEAAMGSGLSPLQMIASPIFGGDGNKEFLLLCEKRLIPTSFVTEDMIQKTVE